MKIVLDTNILVSGLLQPFGPSGQIVRLVAAGELVLCHDSRILAEYWEVLLRKKFRCICLPRKAASVRFQQVGV
ncbi:MAG TPA: putative toxin-antitoxin system toxin component, PIN family [Thermoanaerobaculia bacterium]|nr:putative toxin-antitoxin system toxin component, PIN family [Thermoanaerobaculia bacterium]